MTVSRQIAEAMKRGSFIRKMFEEGRELKRIHGADNVFDFSIGNPDVPPPAEFQRVLEEEAARIDPMIHCYMPNAGIEETREALAASYEQKFALPFAVNDFVMTSGAGGGLNVVLKALLEPGDEVIVLAPLFVEYSFYIMNHQGKMVVSETTSEFLPDLADLEARITDRTRALLINSPNNPTGVVYSRETMKGLGDLLAAASRRQGRPIYLLSDEPYREIIFDDLPYPSPFAAYPETIVVTSNSKDLSLAGERIGHIAISPSASARQELFSAFTFCNRILGFVNANALMQRVVARLQGIAVDRGIYQRRRDTLCKALWSMGFDFVRPQGAFYVFPRSPLADDTAFADVMRDHRVIVVPGAGFHRPGHFRISFAVRDDVIKRSLARFAAAASELGLKTR
jgi:aspartate aminotransferase